MTRRRLRGRGLVNGRLLALALLPVLVGCASGHAMVLDAGANRQPDPASTARPSRASRPAPLPRGWPSKLEFGLVDPPGDARALAADHGFGFRYQYLSGGVNTGHGWATWDPNGNFVTQYDAESRSAGVIPVFSYYQLLQSAPASTASGDERTRDLLNLHDVATMRSWLQDLELFLQRAGTARGPVVLQVEPDLWGYIQQSAAADNASTIPAAVAATGLALTRGLPDTTAGLAQAVVRLRDRYAGNVILAYPLSIWGTGKDISTSAPAATTVAAVAARSSAFYDSLHARFDMMFAEYANSDAAYQRIVDGVHDAWWNPADFARNVSFLARVSRLTRLRFALWQIPTGNTVMRSMNNTRFHYQDNHVQWLLGPDRTSHLRAYVRAGAIGFLFGQALADDTCACDAAHDGITNPAPIDGNARVSRSADDDGGYLRARARAYASTGELTLP